MAHHPSAAKRHRQTVRRTAVNASARSRLRTFIKEVETALATGDKDAARNALRAAQPEMQKSAREGIVHWRTVSRKLSRLSARVKAL
jgi:small subunit ribosomal protein S20